jgi:hypothetical protein
MLAELRRRGTLFIGKELSIARTFMALPAPIGGSNLPQW